jgi:putative exosortase-associated protein (TIGR04073 family)
MRAVIKTLSLLALAGLLGAGCAGPEKKLGRGLNNTTELLRMGELRRTVEQTAMWHGPETAYTTGFLRGMNRTLARTGIGLYEVLTFPFPSYEPVMTHKFSPNPVYPDTYRPNLIEDQTFAPDTNLGFAGGDVIPFVPGSRFRIFDN